MIRPRDIRRLRREGRQLLQQALHPLIITGSPEPSITIHLTPADLKRGGDRD